MLRILQTHPWQRVDPSFLSFSIEFCFHDGVCGIGQIPKKLLFRFESLHTNQIPLLDILLSSKKIQILLTTVQILQQLLKIPIWHEAIRKYITENNLKILFIRQTQ